jgi:catalase
VSELDALRLLEDFILREKITHFDHERIPERIVHARGSAAHGFFECTKALTEVQRHQGIHRWTRKSARDPKASPSPRTTTPFDRSRSS